MDAHVLCFSNRAGRLGERGCTVGALSNPFAERTVQLQREKIQENTLNQM